MAITKIIDNVKLDGNWTKVSLGDFNIFYLIGLKEAKALTDTLDPKDVKIINFEIGIESGITDKYLTIGRATLNFKEETSSDIELNEISAFVRCNGYPSDFYIKPIEIITNTGIIKEGQTSIDININTVKLF